MAPVKKQKSKSINTKEKQGKEDNNNESVVSGQLKKKIRKTQQKPKKDPRGVVFIKHLPHGFFEEQLKKYFEQFGNVTRLRLARSKRTGNSKGYAFIEFEYPEVAEVAAETMDNYLMFKQIIKASYIPPEKQQFNYFRTSVKQIRNKSGKIVWVSGKTADIQTRIKKHNDWSEENYQKRTGKQLTKLKKIGKKYAHLGIDIDELIVQPKILTEKEKDKATLNIPNEENSDCSSKSKKRKVSEGKVSSSKKQNSKKLKNKVTLEDLLGDTIQEDSEDEDYTASGHSEDEVHENEDSSDEDTYNFNKDSESEDDNEEYDEEKASPIVKKRSRKIVEKSNVERLDRLVKRKPHTGGINKLNKKSSKQPSVVTKNKTVLQINAAKELAQPLSKVKSKSKKALKTKKNLIKVK